MAKYLWENGAETSLSNVKYWLMMPLCSVEPVFMRGAYDMTVDCCTNHEVATKSKLYEHDKILGYIRVHLTIF